MKYFSRLFIGIGLFAFLAFLSCGHSDSSAQQITVSGRLSSDYTVARHTIFDKVWAFIAESVSFASGTAVDQIWALPMTDGDLSDSLFGYSQKFSIDNTGSFNLSLGNDRDWVLLLLNTTAADKASQVVGYLTLSSPSGDHMHGLPLSKASADIDMGTLSKKSDETDSSRSTSDNSSSFSISADQLATLAKSDRMLRMVKNIYRNYDASTGTYIRIKPYFSWYKNNAKASIVNTFSDASSTVANDFSGYLYYFHTNNTAINSSNICNAADTLALYPPSSVSNVSTVQGATAGTWTPTSPLSNIGSGGGGGSASSGCGEGQIYFRDDSARDGSPSYQFNYIAGNSSLNPPIPSGDWTVKANSTTVASFEGQLGTPFQDDATATLTIVPIPSVKVTVSSGNVTNVQAKWYQRNSDSSFSEITDSTFLERVHNVSVELSDYSGGGSGVGENGELKSSNSYTYTPSSYTWAYPTMSGSGSKSAQSIAISYDFGGATMRFDFRQY